MTRFLKSSLQTLPYLVMAVNFIVFLWSWNVRGAIVEAGSRFPNEATGETWHVLVRAQTHIYLTPSDWVVFYAPFLMAPFAALAGFLIWRQLWQAGYYDNRN